MYGLGDSGNVCDTTSKMFDTTLCNKLYVPATTPTTLTAWLNTNSTMVVVAAAAFFGLMMLSKGGR